MIRNGLVPVHEPGGVQFEYDVVSFNVLDGSLAQLIAAAEQEQRVEEHILGPTNGFGQLRDEEDSDAAPDFLAFEDEKPPEDAGPAGGAAPSVAHDLLQDYISMGLIENPNAAAAQHANALDDESNEPPPELPRVPWLSSLKGISSPFLRLHQEIVEFNRFVAPSSEEAKARTDSIARIQDVVQSIWPRATVEVFGSFATGLYLPTSDVDAVILNSGCTDIPSGLRALGNSLSRRGLSKNMQIIAKARVPIIKFEESESGYAFDVSFDVANGPEAAANVRALMDSLPPMRPLVTVLKVFLQQRELNEVYSGGLGSYAVLVMVASFLQTHRSRLSATEQNRDKQRAKKGKQQRKSSTHVEESLLETNLGILLVDLFRLYGRTLSHTHVGVSCRRGGGYFSKRSKGFYQDDRPYLLSIEDPNDPENDLGKNSFNATRARVAFEYAYGRLTAPSSADESLLHRIIRLDPALFLREPKPHPIEETQQEGASNRSPAKEKELQEKQRQEPSVEQRRDRGSGGGGGGTKRRHRERSDSEEDWEWEKRKEVKRSRGNQYDGAGRGQKGKEQRGRGGGSGGRGSGGWKGGRSLTRDRASGGTKKSNKHTRFTD